MGLSLFLNACSSENNRFGGDRYRIPWTDSSGRTSLKIVQLKTFKNPENLEGSVAKILVQPSDGGGKLVAEKPNGRYVRTADGTIVPADYVTLQAVTAYAHQEKLQLMDRATGVERYLRWPLTVGIEVKVIDRGSLLTNNAIYDGKLDALMIVPYTFAYLPIAFNGGILAHEHFHFIFQRAVLNALGTAETHRCQNGVASSIAAPADDDGLDETGMTPDAKDPVAVAQASEDIPPDLYNSYLLRSLNEGLADFWGWAYSLDNSFVGRSLPSELVARKLDQPPGRLDEMTEIRSSLVDLRRADKVVRDDIRVGKAYLLGTQYARFMRQLVRGLVDEGGMTLTEAKLAVAKTLIESLPSVAGASLKAYKTEFLSPNFILPTLISKLPKVTPQACEDLENFRALDDDYQTPTACKKETL